MKVRSDEVDEDAEVRSAVLRALARHPDDIWTPRALASALAMPQGLTGRALEELAAAGRITRLPDPEDGYTLGFVEI
jgi:DNA-binding MarR family transcriptional regulator